MVLVFELSETFCQWLYQDIVCTFVVCRLFNLNSLHCIIITDFAMLIFEDMATYMYMYLMLVVHQLGLFCTFN